MKLACVIGLAAPLAIGLSACKTTKQSEVESALPTAAEVSHMTLAQFVAACQGLQGSSDPGDVDAVNTVLQSYAQTTDCTTAYPILEAKISAAGIH